MSVHNVVGVKKVSRTRTSTKGIRRMGSGGSKKMSGKRTRKR